MTSQAVHKLRDCLVSKIHQLNWVEENAQTRDERAVEARRQRLREITAALDLLDHGRYGICEDCGEEIKPGRLKAVPWATRCVACQTEQEVRTSPFVPEEASRVFHDHRSV
ncbi:MAG: TraR/DksA C4-type zinc finger protein [Acidobacteria bacterium]|nr:TraR/DksA C4-type zinc finger protein [Acidobacteriota bacterium]